MNRVKLTRPKKTFNSVIETPGPLNNEQATTITHFPLCMTLNPPKFKPTTAIVRSTIHVHEGVFFFLKLKREA